MKTIYTLGHSVSVVALLVAIAVLVALRSAIFITLTSTFAASLCPQLQAQFLAWLFQGSQI